MYESITVAAIRSAPGIATLHSRPPRRAPDARGRVGRHVTAGSFTAAPGEERRPLRRVRAPPVTVADLGAPRTVGAGCTQGDPVTCDYTSGVTLRLGDRADSGFASATIATAVYGEHGDDEIRTDAEEAQADGGPGEDAIPASAATRCSDTETVATTPSRPLPERGDYDLWGDEGDDVVIQRTSSSRCWVYGGRGADRLLELHVRPERRPGRRRDVAEHPVRDGGAMNGDEGNDVMVGGLAADSFEGGPGATSFRPLSTGWRTPSLRFGKRHRAR